MNSLKKFPVAQMSRSFHVNIAPPATTEVSITKFVDVLARSFDSLPAVAYMGISSTTAPSKEYIDNWYMRVVSSYQKDGGLLVQSHDHAAVALWLPPGFKKEIKPEELAKLAPNVVNLTKTLHEASARHGYDTKDHWHLQYLGRDPDRPGIKGAVSSVMRPFLNHSDEHGIPVVLESAGAKATQVYKHYGFESLETLSFDGEEMIELMVYNK